MKVYFVLIFFGLKSIEGGTKNVWTIEKIKASKINIFL